MLNWSNYERKLKDNSIIFQCQHSPSNADDSSPDESIDEEMDEDCDIEGSFSDNE